MPGPLNLSAGVRSDYSKVLAALKDQNSVRFADFCQIWKDLNMSMIFAGRDGRKELKEFTEDALHHAVNMWIDSPGFQEQVCGLYLVYALYHKQLDEPKTKIRVTQKQWAAAMTFIEEVHEQQHLDVEYIFNMLRFQKAFAFVASSCLVNLRNQQNIDREFEPEEINQPLLDQPSALTEILQLDNIAQLSIIHEKYNQLKCAMVGPDATEPAPAHNVIHSNLVHYITKSVTAHEDWKKRKLGKKGERKRRESGATTTSESEVDSDVEMYMPKRSPKISRDIGRKRKELRDRAFGSLPSPNKSRRYRQVRADDTDTNVSSPNKKKTCSSTKMEEEDEKIDEELPSTSGTAMMLDMPILDVNETFPPKQSSHKGTGRGKSSSQTLVNTTRGRGRGKRGRGRPRKT